MSPNAHLGDPGGGGSNPYETNTAQGVGNILDPMSWLRQGVTTGNWDPFQVSNPNGLNVQGSVDNGGMLDTGLTGADRARQMAYIQQLQNMAAYGDQAALQQLRQAQQSSQNQMGALSQSMALNQGVDSSFSRRNALDTQNQMRQSGGAELERQRAQQQQWAQQQAGAAATTLRTGDINQAAAQQQAMQSMNQANLDAAQAREDRMQRLNSAALSTIPYVGGAMGQSGGGGKGMAYGGAVDSPQNDTVPAMLSPGEIVLPRSVTMAADPVSAAAQFVAMVKAGKGPENASHFADGGNVPYTRKGGFNVTEGSGSFNAPLGTVSNFVGGLGFGPTLGVSRAPFDWAQAGQAYGMQNAAANNLAASMQGAGPSASQVAFGQRSNAGLQAAMAAAASGQNPASMLAPASKYAQDAAAQSGMQTAGENASAAQQYGELINQMRQASFNQAAQEQKTRLAATMSQMGLDTAHQDAMMNRATNAAGTGMSALSTVWGNQRRMTQGEEDNLATLSNNPYKTANSASSPSEWEQPFPDRSETTYSDGKLSDSEGFAYGGQVGFARGGMVQPRSAYHDFVETTKATHRRTQQQMALAASKRGC